MATSPQAFYCLWQNETIRERLFELIPKEDICSVRVANSACCNLVTKRLFLRTNLTFTVNTFTKPTRIQALSRIGHHIEHLTFHFAHSDATFLPPLIHPLTGREISYLYTPHTSMASVLARPKYGNSELGDILMQQYPPLFHAATNVPSFINAIKHLPNMRHLTIKTPGQQPKERYRRDIVDYGLISLRIALERTPLVKLTKLSLSGVHPSAFNYLRPMPGFGPSPSSTRRWRQIKKLYISVESWDFYGPSPGLDHLKIIDDYIRLFAPQVDKFSFTWLGRKGPCPLALSADPLFAPPRSTKKLFAEVTSPMSPLPPRPSRRPMRMPRLRYLQVRNTTMNEPQLRDLVAAHASTVREFDFENVALINDGNWDDALAPLMNGGGPGSDVWSRRSMGGSESSFRPMPALSRSGSGASSGSGVASADEDEQLPASSAAAAAASKELFDVDLDGMVFGGVNDIDAFDVGVEEWALGVSDAAHLEDHPIYHTTRVEDEVEKAETVDDGGLASDIEAAKQASLGFSTKLKKRRLRKKPRKHSDGAESEATTDEPRRHRHHHHHHHNRHQEGGSRLKHSRSDETYSRDRSRHKHTRSDETHSREPSRQRSRSRRRHHGHRRRHHSEEPQVPDMPDMFIAEVLASDDEAAIRPLRRTPTPPPSQPDMDISAPILNPDPLPVLLQPAVYDPSAKTGPMISNNSSNHAAAAPMAPLTKTPSNKSLASNTSSSSSAAARAAELAAASHADDGCLSAVQLRIEAELLEAEEEAAARSSALRRAKETVLAKLSREFCKRKGAGGSGNGSKDSAAVMGLPGMNLGTGITVGGCAAAAAAGGGGGGFGSRWGSGLREGLFGRSVAAAAANVGAVQPDHRSMESQTALVPLIFSRS